MGDSGGVVGVWGGGKVSEEKQRNWVRGREKIKFQKKNWEGGGEKIELQKQLRSGLMRTRKNVDLG